MVKIKVRDCDAGRRAKNSSIKRQQVAKPSPLEQEDQLTWVVWVICCGRMVWIWHTVPVCAGDKDDILVVSRLLHLEGLMGPR